MSPPRTYNARLGNQVRELCSRHGILDRMPRYIKPGPRSINKKVAERLFLKTYDLELEMASNYQIWAYRKAAWTVDEMPENIALIYTRMGQDGLRQLPLVGKSIASQIAKWLEEEGVSPD